MSNDAGDMVKADPVYRRNLFLAYGVVLAVGTAIVAFALPWLARTLQSMPAKPAFAVVEVLLVCFLLSFAGPATYLIIVGRRVLRHDRMPYPGMKTIRDARIIRGTKARIVGRALACLGGTGILMALAGAAMTHFFFERFRADPLFRAFFR